MRNDTVKLPIRQRACVTARQPLTAAKTRAPARSLYLHIPFCFHKCHYCDFYSLVDTRDRQQPFVERLQSELRALVPWAGPLRTVFVGGGTPSLLRADLWRGLLNTLHGLYDLSDPRLEFTVECNPETVTPELMGILAEGGVNRVSIGAQSFDARHLKTLERWHDPANVERAVGLARAAGIARQSVDLIFGIPGQTLDHWERDLSRALALGTTHLSSYDLTYEPNTAMTARRDRGEFQPADEEAEVAMFEATVRRAQAAGLARYEVSNYARPGDECRHNLAYWRHEDWLAAGASASAHVAGHRWKNVPRLDDYLSIDDEGFAPITDHEPPDEGRAVRERIMTGLRLAEGVDRTDVFTRIDAVAPGRAAAVGDAAARFADRGWLTTESGRWRLTDAGFLFADRVAGDLMRLIP